MTPPLSPAPELSADQVRKAVDLSPLAFATTADLEPQTALVGQERAVQALQMGIAMPQPGYNIFASDVAGTGARTQITALLQDRAVAMPTPGDWVYVHNFRQPDQPSALTLQPGQGSRLANLPVRQDLAVTGSVNQAGNIQALVGVNEKIEE